MAARSNVVSIQGEDARKRDLVFREWLASTETAYLECRNGRHIIPGWTDESTSMEVRQGMCLVESPCKRCGVLMRKVVGVRSGYLIPGARASYDYTPAPGYLLPPEACDGASMSRERRAEVRLELMERGFAAHGTTLAKAVAADKHARRR